MPDIGRVRVAVDVGRPFEFGRVGVTGTNIARLKLLELLLGAEFVCLLDGRAKTRLESLELRWREKGGGGFCPDHGLREDEGCEGLAG